MLPTPIIGFHGASQMGSNTFYVFPFPFDDFQRLNAHTIAMTEASGTERLHSRKVYPYCLMGVENKESPAYSDQRMTLRIRPSSLVPTQHIPSEVSQKCGNGMLKTKSREPVASVHTHVLSRGTRLICGHDRTHLDL